MTEAVRLYGTILATNPHDADALHLLGVASDAQGNPARAVGLISQALAIRETASFRSNLANEVEEIRSNRRSAATYD